MVVFIILQLYSDEMQNQYILLIDSLLELEEGPRGPDDSGVRADREFTALPHFGLTDLAVLKAGIQG
jgi:hypothetical protein